MRPRIDVEVDPLSEQRWAKIERATFSRLDAEVGPAFPSASRPGKSTIAVTLAAACAIVCLIVTGWAFRMAQKGESRLAPNPSRITTGLAESHLDFAGISLDVKRDSVVVISGARDSGVLIVVERGAVSCDAEPRTAGAPLIVQAGGVQVRVVGTRFTVTRLSESAEVEVARGIVEVHSSGQSWEVRAGETWPPPEARGLAAAASNAGTEPSPAVGEPSPELGAGRDALQGRRGSLRLGSRSRATSPAPSDEPARDGGRALVAPAYGGGSRELYESAAGLEVSDAPQAIALYERLETGHDSWAQIALFAHGRLEATRRNKAEAERLLREYLVRFPRGANARDARIVLERLR